MAAWDAGYVTEIEYTYGYYSEMNPLNCILPLLRSGIMPPKAFENACELGFGQGVSTNIHAAASQVKWYGTDFNPSQASFAQETAEVSENGAVLHELGFEDFNKLDGLPEFDFIALHGIWSWISKENQDVIVDFIRKKLKVGGVVYISYNTMPGWAAFAPVRQLMIELHKANNKTGDGIVKNVSDTMSQIDAIFETNPAFVKVNPSVTKRLEALKKKDKHYIAHEYFNDDWCPMYFSQAHEALSPAKIDFAASAAYLEHFDFLTLTADQQKIYNGVTDKTHKQIMRDYLVNQQFRRDYWVKGSRTMTAQQQQKIAADYSVILLKDRKSVKLSLKVANGEANLNADIYNPILNILADGKIHKISELQKKLSKNKISFTQLLQALMVLQATQALCSANDEKLVTKLKIKTDKLNKTLIQKNIDGQQINYLSSPVTGGGFNMQNNSILFVAAMLDGNKTAVELAGFTIKILSLNNQVLVRKGKQISKPDAIKKILKEEAETFLKSELPTLMRLNIL